MTYEHALDELSRTPLAAFVVERKRMAAALKAAGDKDGAARLAKVPRPTASAWAINQLWWHARAAFEAMFASAARLRAGALDASATAAHREAIAALRARAAKLLADGGHGATEAVLRRVTTTLAALAVDGGFGADRPGTLAEDRESPGFAAAGVTMLVESPAAGPAPAHHAAQQDAAAAHLAVEAARAAAAAERRAREQEKARRSAEQRRLEGELRAARAGATLADKDVAHLEGELAEARGVAGQARALVEDLTSKLAALVDETGSGGA